LKKENTCSEQHFQEQEEEEKVTLQIETHQSEKEMSNRIASSTS